MGQDALNHRRIDDGGDDLQLARHISGIVRGRQRFEAGRGDRVQSVATSRFDDATPSVTLCRMESCQPPDVALANFPGKNLDVPTQTGLQSQHHAFHVTAIRPLAHRRKRPNGAAIAAQRS